MAEDVTAGDLATAQDVLASAIALLQAKLGPDALAGDDVDFVAHGMFMGERLCPNDPDPGCPGPWSDGDCNLRVLRDGGNAGELLEQIRRLAQACGQVLHQLPAGEVLWRNAGDNA